MTDEYAEFWASRAKTPETRARIRRWALLKRVFFGLAGLSSTASVTIIVVAAIREVLGEPAPRWVFLAALAVLVVSILPWCLASFRLDVARYADGEELSAPSPRSSSMRTRIQRRCPHTTSRSQPGSPLGASIEPAECLSARRRSLDRGSGSATTPVIRTTLRMCCSSGSSMRRTPHSEER